MPAIRFAAAKPEDAEDLAGLLLDCHRHYWDAAPDDTAMARDMAERFLDGRSGCTAVLALLDDVPAGFATYALLHPAPNENGVLFLKDLYVSATARGTGLGRRFMRHLAQVAVDLGCSRFDWTAEASNPGALRFYEGLGAERVTEKVYFRLSGDSLAAEAAGSAP